MQLKKPVWTTSPTWNQCFIYSLDWYKIEMYNCDCHLWALGIFVFGFAWGFLATVIVVVYIFQV